MTTFSEKLRQEREARNISLHEIATETKIGLRYLKALESGDFASLPGGVFNKGYVRAFATFIGADADGLVQAYVEEERTRGADGGPEERDVLRALAASATSRSPKRMGVRPAIFLVPLSVALVAVVVWGYLRFVEPGDGPAAAAGSPTAARESAPAETEPTTVPDPPPVEPREVAPASPPAPRPAETVELEPAAVAEVKIAPPRAEIARASPSDGTETEPVEPAAVEPESSGLSIPEAGVGTGIVNRRLQGQSDRFTEGTRIWFWTKVVGGRPGDRIRHIWFRDGRQVSSVELKLGGSHWRTQSRKTLLPDSVGPWAVEARDVENRLLAREEFVCVR